MPACLEKFEQTSTMISLAFEKVPPPDEKAKHSTPSRPGLIAPVNMEMSVRSKVSQPSRSLALLHSSPTKLDSRESLPHSQSLSLSTVMG